MKKYKIEEAGAGFIGHWFYFMLTALYKINDKNCKVSICLDDKDLTDYQTQSLEILSYKYKYTADHSDSIFLPSIKPLPSATLSRFNFFKFVNKNTFMPKKYYFFLRDLFEEAINLNYVSKINNFPKKIFIKRSGSHLLKGNSLDSKIKNIKRRQIINEYEIEKLLKKKGFFIVDTADYHVGDKLLLFKNAKIILGANGGGLTYTFFAGQNTKICEIVTKNPHQYIDHYKDQSYALGLQFYRFDKVIKKDELDNIIVNEELLMDYLLSNNLL